LQILAYTLPADGHTYSKYTFNSSRFTSVDAPTQQPDDLVYSVLSIPEIKGLVIEAWCTQNICSIHWEGNSFEKDVPYDLPPAHIRPYVRSIQLSIIKCGAAGLRLLTTIADGSLGFKNMYNVDITFDGYACNEFNAYLEAMPAIEFPTRSLKIKYGHDVYNGPIEGFGYGTKADLVEMPLLEKLMISADNGRVKVEWVRYYETSKGKEMTEDWPAITAHFWARSTEKIVRV
jgi:hypothetical protein